MAWLAGLTCALTATSASAATAPESPEIVFERAARSVATVHSVDAEGRILARGSGVVLLDDMLVTNCHVVARGRQFLVGHNKKRFEARLLAYDAARDLCVLEAKGIAATSARIADGKALKVGQRVYAIGAPEGFELTLSDGLISGLRDSSAGRYIQITAPISDGSSGGGLFDASGRLIGIVSFSFSPGQNLNFAATADGALELARRATSAVKTLPTRHVDLPVELTRQWRHPFMR